MRAMMRVINVFCYPNEVDKTKMKNKDDKYMGGDSDESYEREGATCFQGCQ